MNKTTDKSFVVLVALIAVLAGWVLPKARGQSFQDDFNDGNDVGWTHYSPLEPFDFGADYSFPNGNSYQIDVPGNYIVPEIERGRAGSMVTGSNYSDFRITVDVLGWNDGREYVFGPIARASTPGLGTTNGYLLLLHASDHDFQLLRIEGEAPADEELGTADIEMPPERQFRIVYSGLGPQLSAMVYNLNNLSTPLGAFTADTENYLPPPAPEPYTTGQVGLIVAQADGPTDPAPPPGAPYAATFDNFRVTVPTAAEWNALGGGSISEGFNWIGNSMPQGAGVHAKFLHGAETDADVNVDAFFYTLGKITFDNDHRYKLTGQAVTFENTGSAEIEALSGSHEIASEMIFASDVRKTGPGTVTLSGAIEWMNHSLEVAAGKLRIPKVDGNTVNVSGGTLTLIPGAGTSLVSNVAIGGGGTPTGTLDLADNPAVIEYTGASPADTVRQQILAGRGGAGFGATWTGNGITSSTAAAENADSPEARSVGYAENSNLPLGAYTNFRGQAVDGTSILLAYTRTGDANLDGVVNDDDVTIVSATYAPGVANAQWALGDFDYNGFVDDDDITLLGAFYDPSASPVGTGAMPPAGLQAVPEPSSIASIAVAAIAALGCVGRRRLQRRGLPT
jgi:hypothetical protein